MENKYKEIMSHVSVDEQMRNRILANISAADLSPSATPIKAHKSAMKTIIRITPFVAAAAILAIVGINVLKSADTSSSANNHNTVHAGSDSVAEETVAEASMNSHSSSIFGIDDTQNNNTADLDYNFSEEAASEESDCEIVRIIATYELSTDSDTTSITLFSDGTFVEESAVDGEICAGTYAIDGAIITFASQADGTSASLREFNYSEDAIINPESNLTYSRK